MQDDWSGLHPPCSLLQAACSGWCCWAPPAALLSAQAMYSRMMMSLLLGFQWHLVHTNRNFTLCGFSGKYLKFEFRYVWPISHDRTDQVWLSIFQADRSGRCPLWGGRCPIRQNPLIHSPSIQRVGSDRIGWKWTGCLFSSDLCIEESGDRSRVKGTYNQTFFCFR